MVTRHCQPLLRLFIPIMVAVDTIGTRIKEAREAAGLNQAQLAARIGVERQAISQLESGVTKNPKPANLLKIARVTGYSIVWLIEGRGPRNAKEAAEDWLDLSNLDPQSKAALRALMDSLQQQTKETSSR